MNYLDIDFPEKLSFCFSGGPEFATIIACAKNKQETCNQIWNNPRYRYNLSYRTCNKEIYKQLINFFLICKGQSTAFNFLDKNDNKINRQQIGVGDGQNLKFQIYKTYTYENYTYERPIFKVKNVKVFINNKQIQDEDFTIKNNILLFNDNIIPPAGHVISIDATFFVIVRFEQDFLPVTYKSQSVELSEICLVETSVN